MRHIPLYTEVDYGPVRELSLDDYAPDIWDAMRGGFQEGLKYSPLAAMENWSETNPQYARGADFAGMTAEDAIDLALEGKGLPDWHVKMPVEKQKEYIASMGLAGQVEPHEDYEERSLKIICEGRQEDNSLAELRKNMGWRHMPFSLAAGFAAGMIDPLAVASAFVPAIPEQRVLHMLAAQAHSAAGRAGVRAVQGAANGALGAALLEPMIAAGNESMQRDYDLAMSLCNMAFGATLGAALHPVAGHVGEWLSRRNGGWLPWEMGMATPASEKLRLANEKLFEDVRMGANPNQDRALVSRQAKADALTWDAHMRHIAFTEKIATEEAYARNPFDMFNAERFRQETAVNQIEVARWTKEVEEQESLRQMREQFPELRIGDDLDNARERLAYYKASLVDSARSAERDLEAMFTGESLFAKKRDWSTLDPLEPKPELMEKFGNMESIDVQYQEWEKSVWQAKPVGGNKLANHVEGWLCENVYAKPGTIVAYEAARAGLGTVRASKRNMMHLLSNRFTEYKARLIPELGKIIETAEYAGRGYRSGIKDSHILVNKVKLNGRDSIVGIVLQETNGRLNLYDIELALLQDKLLSKVLPSGKPQRRAIYHEDKAGQLSSVRTSPDGAHQLIQSYADNVNANENLPLTLDRLRNLNDHDAGNVTAALRAWFDVENPSSPYLFQFSSPRIPGETPAIMGATTFPVDGRAIVRIFESHDFTTVSHELAHVLRRQYQRLAASPNTSAALKKQYRNMESAFGIDEDGVWNTQAEELFAESYVKYMMTGEAPSAAMAQSFAIMREQGAALYADADRAGVNISDEMRDVFNNMLTTPMEKGDRLLREAVADLATRRWERELLPRPAGPRKPGDAVGLEHDPSPSCYAMEREGKSLQEVTGLDPDDLASLEYLQQSAKEIGEANERALELDPNLSPQEKERIRQEWAAEDEALALEAADIEEQGKAMEEYVHCLLRQA